MIFGFKSNLDKTSMFLRIFSLESTFISKAFVGHTLTHVPHPLHLNLSTEIPSDSIEIALYGHDNTHNPHVPHLFTSISIPVNSVFKNSFESIDIILIASSFALEIVLE